MSLYDVFFTCGTLWVLFHEVFFAHWTADMLFYDVLPHMALRVWFHDVRFHLVDFREKISLRLMFTYVASEV